MAVDCCDVSLSDARSMLLLSANLVDVLSDEVLEQLCCCLPGRELLRFAAAAKQLQMLTRDSEGIWRTLSYALLGEPICRLHCTLARKCSREIDTVWWRRLFRQAQELKVAKWSCELRAEFLKFNDDKLEPAAREKISEALVASGHCSVGLGGGLVVKLGGLRPQCRRRHIYTAVFDLDSLNVCEVELTEDSARPERRLRHAACEVKPDFLRGQSAILVLGGCGDVTKLPCEGGLRLLHILELHRRSTSLYHGKWHSLPATGEAPAAIWHHICGSFAARKQVVVFGGDFQRSDPEFVHIEDRQAPSSCVYVLTVDSRVWERVRTTGPAPPWRSLHAGFTHQDIASHSERMVILGGCEAHVPIFSSSDRLASMRGHALDLQSFRWLPPPADAQSELPSRRLRLSSEKLGEWLVLYGGHGENSSIGERKQLFKLNLRTLLWDTVRIRGREGSHPAAPAATLSAGLVLGGVHITMLGITPVPKLDVLTLCLDPASCSSGEEDNDEDSASERASDSAEDGLHDDRVLVEVHRHDGSVRRMILPRAMARFLANTHNTAADETLRAGYPSQIGQ
eukprot:TRINITY_DN7799_c1_g2_i1.p1 TRINITY_DN7799_c1_g2~~TRINITY_DN7799_c1_g2_i1.p1  ORF type:complete len:568 (-),score=94.65 TRINITY_DN7799_c1_g2_i1:23-1726(-)